MGVIGVAHSLDSVKPIPQDSSFLPKNRTFYNLLTSLQIFNKILFNQLHYKLGLIVVCRGHKMSGGCYTIHKSNQARPAFSIFLCVFLVFFWTYQAKPPKIFIDICRDGDFSKANYNPSIVMQKCLWVVWACYLKARVGRFSWNKGAKRKKSKTN